MSNLIIHHWHVTHTMGEDRNALHSPWLARKNTAFCQMKFVHRLTAPVSQTFDFFIYLSICTHSEKKDEKTYDNRKTMKHV